MTRDQTPSSSARGKKTRPSSLFYGAPPASRPNYLGLVTGVGFGRKSERKNPPACPPWSVFLVVWGRGRRFLRRCPVGVGLGVGALTAGTVGVAVSPGVGVGNSIVAGQFSRAGLFATHWATPVTIATVTEVIPAAIAQRARRWVCRCLASLCLRSTSLRISASRSDAVMISFGGSVGSDWISTK